MFHRPVAVAMAATFTKPVSCVCLHTDIIALGSRKLTAELEQSE